MHVSKDMCTVHLLLVHVLDWPISNGVEIFSTEPDKISFQAQHH